MLLFCESAVLRLLALAYESYCLVQRSREGHLMQRSNTQYGFHPCPQEDESVRLVGVEASGHGLDTEKHAATLTKGTPGVLHGSFSFLLQDSEGQIIDPHSISAGCAALAGRLAVPRPPAHLPR